MMNVKVGTLRYKDKALRLQSVRNLRCSGNMTSQGVCIFLTLGNVSFGSTRRLHAVGEASKGLQSKSNRHHANLYGRLCYIFHAFY